jgi:hypothetical protein
MIRLRRKHLHHLDKKLRRRLKIYFVISIIMICVVIFEVLSGNLSLSIALIGLMLGVFIGVIAARMFLVSWHNDAKKVISRLDIVGGAILILYIVFAIFRGRIIGHFVQRNYITGASISLITGIMIGRVFGTGNKIVSILKEQNLFKG